MKIVPTPLPGVVVVEPTIHGDARGYFYESYNRRDFDAALRTAGFGDELRTVDFVQDNQSRSRRGVLRGLHYQLPPHAQSKLVRVASGCVWDVAVDLRNGSPTFGQWFGVELSAENHRQLFIPRGLAHGYVVLSDEAVFQYKCDDYYAPRCEGGLAWDDPALAIDWPVAAAEVILSDRDRRHPRLADLATPPFPEPDQLYR